jgi:rubrerythrin
MQESRRPRINKKDLLLLEDLDQYQRRDVICNILSDVIKDEEDAIPTYEDLRTSLYTYLPETSVNEIINPIMSDERRHKEVLSKLASRIGCKKR